MNLKSSRMKYIFAFIVVALLGYLFYLAFVTDDPRQLQWQNAVPDVRPEPVPLQISKETTFLTEPLRDDGTVNYIAALNALLSEGVTPETNTVVSLAQLLGPDVFFGNRAEDERLNVSFYSRLSTERPFTAKNRFLLCHNYAREVTGEENSDLELTLSDQVHTAGTRPWNRGEFQELSGWLDYNIEFADKIHSAMMRADYYSPYVSDDPDNDLEGMLHEILIPFQQESRGFARFLLAHAMVSLNEGNPEVAMQNLEDCHRLARKIGMGVNAIELLIGIAIDSLAFDAEIGMLQSGQLSENQLENYLERLKTLPPLSSIAEKINLGERLFVLDVAIQIARKNYKVLTAFPENSNEGEVEFKLMELSQWVDLNALLRLINTQFDQLVSAASAETFEQRIQAAVDYEKHLDDLQAKLEKLANEDLLFIAQIGDRKTPAVQMAEYYLVILAPAIKQQIIAESRATVRKKLMQIAFTLELHQRKQGRFPETLADIEPAIPPEQLVDFFSAEPLIYELTEEGYLLYSVGENMQDDGGVSFYDEPPGDDIVIRRHLK